MDWKLLLCEKYPKLDGPEGMVLGSTDELNCTGALKVAITTWLEEDVALRSLSL